ncbi:MAG: PEP-CTERM sorting domain-containing protein [Aquabacterium sp.]|nr:PEP-CTERM sorting domain-containing protein [Aquabacterium sp.]
MKNHRSLIASTLMTLGVLAGATAPAQANLLTNGSFEAAGPNLSGTGSYCYLGIGDYRECGSVPGWSGSFQVIASTSGPWNNPSTNGGWTATQGARLAGVQNTSYLEQTLTLFTGQFTLSWLDSNRKNYGSGNSYDVLLDGTTLATFLTNTGEAWASNSLSFTASAGTHTLRFQGLRANGDGTSFIDELSLTGVPAQVPEPQSFALVALALLGLGAVRRRQRSR